MSWWTKFRDRAEKVATLGFYDPVKSRREEAEARYAINDQIKAFKDQSELSRKMLEQKKSEGDVLKRKIQEKQIRSLRNTYRSPSMLGMGASASGDISQKLGG